MKLKEKILSEVVEARNSRKRKSWSRGVLLYVTKDKAFVDNEVRSLSELAFSETRFNFLEYYRLNALTDGSINKLMHLRNNSNL